MSEEQKVFPKGQIAMGNGDLIDVTNVRFAIVNNGKQIHTLRRSGAGMFKGNEETTVSFDAVVSEDGPERDYLKMVKTGAIKALRLKIPGETVTVNGMVTSRTTEFSTDNEIKFSLEFKGKAEDPGQVSLL